jgi:CheY-like chemotaxis protein
MLSFGVVALFNSNPDAIVLITRLLESAGFTVVSALIPEVRDGRCDVDALMTDHDPSVVVYDIDPPYEENWAMFEDVRARPSMSDCRFVITAADAAEVERLAGHDERIFEVVDKNSGLGDLAHAVKEAARARALIRADPSPQSNVTPMPDRRFHSERRSAWTSNDIYRKLREKRDEVEMERRRGGRRVTDAGPDHSHAA